HVTLRRGRHQRDAPCADAHELHRLARRAEAGLDLWTDRHPLDVRTEDVHEVRVTLVPAVPAHAVPEQARRDPDARPLAHRPILSRKYNGRSCPLPRRSTSRPRSISRKSTTP